MYPHLFYRDPIANWINFLEKKKPGDVFFSDDGEHFYRVLKDTMTGKTVMLSKKLTREDFAKIEAGSFHGNQ